MSIMMIKVDDNMILQDLGISYFGSKYNNITALVGGALSCLLSVAYGQMCEPYIRLSMGTGVSSYCI